ncbi:MAG: alpha/beta hydrolase [Zoogloeaceae bacterium]|nr:alpha/beta hydrolase [Zoogloeaceae bacterium]
MKLDIEGIETRVAVTPSATGTGRPKLLLIHGAANDSDAWRDISPLLAAQGINTYAPDLPGHGQSAGTPISSIEALADWVLRLIDALKLDSVTLAGHSMGSLVALETTARNDSRINALALLGASVPMPVSEALLDTARTAPDAACRMVTIWSHTPGFFSRGGGGHGVWGAGKTLAVMRRNSTTLATDLSNCQGYESGLASARAISCPNLIIAGKRDRMTPLRAIQPLQESLQHARRYDIDDCGHAMMTEKPKEVADALLSLLNQGS